ncbi:MAG: hypothetical protein A07HR60_01340 [uncultured archaeon A07HR60]|nr:MAG: hypothetical protein A07HR60_01340 [uncultured archaeon A07HR60]
MWTSAFLHGSVSHLYSNLIGYGIGIGFAYYLYVQELGRRRRFWITVAALFIVVPPVATVIDYLVLYRYAGLVGVGATSSGFSGIVSALGGVIFAGMGALVTEEYDRATGTNTMLLVLPVALGGLAAANGIMTPAIASLTGIAILLQGTRFVSPADLRHRTRLHAHLAEHTENIARIGAYGAVVCVFLYLILPVEFVQTRGFTNILAHTVGFVSGIRGAILVESINSG